MENRQPLLSICIPTYNRSEYLREALENITSDPEFDDRVEIIISDNASTDNTEYIVNCFVRLYSNIFYYKNPENVRDENFILALSRSRGKYVRLFNDTLRLKQGALRTMLDVISRTSDAYALFFIQNGNMDKQIDTKGESGLLFHVSFYITWIANFGCWKSELNKLNTPNKYSSLQLSQVDWFLQIAKMAPCIKICFGDYFDSVMPKHKGGYNIFKVFVHNYLLILKAHNISFFQYEIEKFRLLRYFIVPWWIKIANDKRLTFKTNGKWGILFKHYILSPYFYFFILYINVKILLIKKTYVFKA